jgi:hypothetical protein
MLKNPTYSVDEKPEVFCGQAFQAAGGQDVVQAQLHVLQSLLLTIYHSEKSQKRIENYINLNKPFRKK